MSSDQMPAPGKTKLIKFPPSRAGKDVKCPGYARGGGVEASIWLIHKQPISSGKSSKRLKRRILLLLLNLWKFNLCLKLPKGRKYSRTSNQLPPWRQEKVDVAESWPLWGGRGVMWQRPFSRMSRSAPKRRGSVAWLPKKRTKRLRRRLLFFGVPTFFYV